MFGLTRVDAAFVQLREAFLEDPGTTLTVEQACAITRLDQTTSLLLLLALERSRFLRRSTIVQFSLCAGWNDGDNDADGD